MTNVIHNIIITTSFGAKLLVAMLGGNEMKMKPEVYDVSVKTV